MNKTSPFRKPALLFFGTAAVWIVVALPLGLLSVDGSSWIVSGVAAWLCVLSGLAVFLMSDGLPQRGPEVKVVVVFLATFVRMAGVFGGGVAVYYTLPIVEAQGKAFIGWLIVFYLVTLAIETRLLISAPSSGQRPSDNGS